MKESIKDTLMIFGALVIASVVGCVFDRCHRTATPPASNECDTIYVHDTLIVRDTIPQEVERYVIRHDTVRVIVVGKTDKTEPDSVGKADSVTVVIPIEQSAYHGEGYDAWVSGYRAKLDSIHLSIPTTTITIKPKPKRWGVGVQVGYGITPRHTPQPFIGIGISYNLFSW